MTILMILSVTNASMFTFIKHPLAMTIMIMMKTVIIALLTGMLNKTFWFSYIMFMIMMGGMLVIIIYMTSTASNEKFKINNKLMLVTVLILFTSLICLSVWPPFSLLNNMNINDTMPFTNEMNNMSLNKFISSPMNKIMLFMFIYLFITLIAIVKITNLEKGPLRQKF